MPVVIYGTPTLFTGATAGSTSDCDQSTNWTSTATLTLDSEVYIQKTAGTSYGSLSAKVTKTDATHTFALSGTVDLTDTVIYGWILGSSVAQFKTKAQGGISFKVQDLSGNWGEWALAGSDVGYAGGWQCLAVRTTAAFTSNTATSPIMSSISQVKIGTNISGTAAKPNVWWDALRYGTGLGIKGGTSGTPATFADIVAAEATETNMWGVVVPVEGVLMTQGRLTFGSTTSGDPTFFRDINKVLVFRDRPFGTGFYQMNLVGNAYSSSSVYFGLKSGTKGVSGCGFRCAGASKYTVDATNANVTMFGFYCCPFYDADVISLPAYDASKEVIDCAFEASARITPSTTTMTGCKVVSADSGGIIFASGSRLTASDIISCPRGVEIQNSGSYTFNALKFAGNSYDILNSTVSGHVTVNCENLANPTTSLNISGGWTTIVNTVPLRVDVIDEATIPISGASVYVASSGPTQLMNEVTDASGIATESYNYVGNEDVTVRVRHSSSGLTRYYPVSTVGTITDTGFYLKQVLIADIIVT